MRVRPETPEICLQSRFSVLVGDGDASGSRKPRLQIEPERFVFGVVERRGLCILVDQRRPHPGCVLYSLRPSCGWRGGVMDENLGIERFGLLELCGKESGMCNEIHLEG